MILWEEQNIEKSEERRSENRWYSFKKKTGLYPFLKSDEKIFVAGVGADDIGMQCGGWTISWQGDMGDITEGTTILEAIKDRAGSQNVVYSDDGDTDEEFDKAVVVIGEQPYAEGEGDREDLTISNDDIALVRKVYEQGKPTIVILLSGRPMIINPILHYSDAIFAAWLPGTEGQGIADVLFGEFQPSGKLSHSWPKYLDQIPINVGDQNYDPLYEYDFGLTSVNDSEEGTDPQFYSAIINEAEETIEIAFNKSIDPASLTESTFSLKVDGIPNEIIVTPRLSEESSDKIYFELPVEIEQEQKLVISYLSGSIKSEDGGSLQLFSNKFVYNVFNEVLQPFMLPGKIEAEDYHYMSGIQTQVTSDVGGGLNVGWIESGDWLQYYVSFAESGLYQVNYRVAAESQNGILSLRNEESIINSTLLPVTNGWQNWETVSAEVEMEKGEYFIDLYAAQGGFNINWFSFDLISNVDQQNLEYNFSLGQNYPNPFNPSTFFSYSIHQNSFVKLKLYDALGCEVECIVCKSQTAGKHTIVYDASDLSSGVYYYRLTAGTKSEVKKLLLLK
ncbi:MAG: glycoside hydrolase family 3 C-terminal domain-containing protein [Melioribacteraceae bacterium]|nr:glycoside hydrolase family 3 C-terminal domain-containing protein [Melioribacteraceae bacterium]